MVVAKWVGWCFGACHFGVRHIGVRHIGVRHIGVRQRHIVIKMTVFGA
jgi:hypothetical protein